MTNKIPKKLMREFARLWNLLPFDMADSFDSDMTAVVAASKGLSDA